MPAANLQEQQTAWDHTWIHNRAEADRQVQVRLAELRDPARTGGRTWSGEMNLGEFGTYAKDYFYAVQSLRDGYNAQEVDQLIQQFADPAPAAGGGDDPAATPTDPATEPTPEQKSARAYIDEMLGQWGLGDLSGWAWEQIQAGNVEMLPQLIRGTDAYKARFKGLEARRASGLNVMSEAEYLNLENDYREVMHRYGIPRGSFDTQDYLATLIANDLSPSEVNDRLRIYQDAAFTAPAEVRQQLTGYFGITEGGLMAYYIDPERALPALAQQYATAGAGAAAQLGGFGGLARDTAERIAQLGAGLDDIGTFENLRRSQELFTGLGSEADQAVISREAAAEAAFGGNAAESERMRKRAEHRVADFSGGGGFTQGQGGISGLGDTSN